ncbi:bifunctional lysylphosphatidylglycerol synthetase/lysine--tRNA ligase LysX [Corynebacterium sp. 320]|uniref:bifunctional lysylphosphatidylglycerol synthetase/lysine--tRNA ligase LysX n=1 Tax=Corynebacterium TaxID=1716 RepID=UPI00125CC056|nr:MULTISPECIES: bifunctional lysylphosphatidylglycerol synthetase/lysine--tRNA ligase LysX [Corynebacterium]KAB1503836.1 bifunctional lysylphosphatidylglycerol synthetase/lysine--tRNA ligase LysX [Corynebacterium sp. 320]KAB1553063.1 bifunctional lysylphosphatidylglycerol synthetase/lysine--tRNA ligase LysX [Corynebacterium sp. 321]KAB3527972.1 bifunctional lysylphosphatidylglycerol synthetase/lysine--tRNA ligase LysX [Corynebacterium sp. 250]KAB3540538.1 bifunctional lysylphosphatidylglycerol
MKTRSGFFPRYIGTSIWLYALLSLGMTISRAVESRLGYLAYILDLAFLPMPVDSIAWSVILFLLGLGLSRGKRLAWCIAIGGLALLNGANIAVMLADENTRIDHHYYGPLFYLGVAVQAFFLVLMLLRRHDFAVRTREGAVGRALSVWLGGVVAVFLIGSLLVHYWPGTLNGHHRYGWVANHAMAFSIVDGDLFQGHPPLWVSLVISLLSAIVLIAAMVTLVRSQQGENTMSEQDEQAVRALLGAFGAEDSLGYFATRRDKSVIFAPNGAAAVTYRVENGVSLASADPIGESAHWDAAVQAWLEHSMTYGWTPAVMGASERGAAVYERHGLRSLHLGDEAVVYTDSFRLKTPVMKPVRQAISHAERFGVQLRFRRHGEISADEFAAISQRADAWRDTSDERGFSMALSRLGDEQDGRCLLVEALVDSEPVAMLSFVPWGPSGLSLDLMRRGPQAPNGTVETMIAGVCTHEDLKVSRVSLNFAVFREIFASEDRVAVGAVTRWTRKTLSMLSKRWQMESLYKSNQKYQPLWLPRYLCFPDSLSLGKVGMASARAEGFIPDWTGRDTVHNAVRSQPEAQWALHYVRDAQRTTQRRVSEQSRIRHDKAQHLMERGIQPWPVAVAPSITCADVATAEAGRQVRVSGRVLRRRDFGGVLFLDIRDAHGSAQILSEGSARQEFKAIDLGDIIAVDGTIGASRNGTSSVMAESLTVEAKSLHPPASQQDAVGTVVARLTARNAVTTAFREVLRDGGFMEVETPILQRVHGGANARPFTTHLNAYDVDLYLRIAPELYLKRLMVQGAEKIFELGRVFRNEGVDASHNPEFTSLEVYEAHGDYTTMRVLAEQLIKAAARQLHGQELVHAPDGTHVSIAEPWPVKSVCGAISEAVSEELGTKVVVDHTTPVEELQQLCDQLSIDYRVSWDEGQLIEELYETFVEARTTLPTFYCDFPTSVSPLTRQHRTTPGLTERWDLVAWGMELGTGYSELTDPLEQRRRLEDQSLKAAGGDPEAMEVDEEFLHALEIGMPPTGGLGLGVDRIIMLLTGTPIRDVLAFTLADRHGRSQG